MADVEILVGAKGGDKLDGESGLEIRRNLSNQLANGIKIKVGIADGVANQLQSELDKIAQGLTLNIKNIQLPSGGQNVNNNSNKPTRQNTPRTSPVNDTVRDTMAESFRVATQRAQALRDTTGQIGAAMKSLSTAYNQFIYNYKNADGSAYKKNLQECLTLVNKLCDSQNRLEKSGMAYVRTVEDATDRYKTLLQQYQTLNNSGHKFDPNTTDAMNRVSTLFGQMPQSFDNNVASAYPSIFGKALQDLNECLVAEKRLAEQHKQTVAAFMSDAEWETLSSGMRTATKSAEGLTVKANGLKEAIQRVKDAYELLEQYRKTDQEADAHAMFDEELRTLKALATESRALSSEAKKQSFVPLSKQELDAMDSGLRKIQEDASHLTTKSAELGAALGKLKTDLDDLKKASGSGDESAKRAEYERQLKLVNALVSEEKKRESHNAGPTANQLNGVAVAYEKLCISAQKFGTKNAEVTQALERLMTTKAALDSAQGTSGEKDAFAAYKDAAANMQIVIDKYKNLHSEANKTTSAIAGAAQMQASFDTYVNNLNPKAWKEFEAEISYVRQLLDRTAHASGEVAKSLQKEATDAIRRFKAEMKQAGYDGGNIFTYLEGKIKSFTTYFVASKISTGIIGKITEMKNTVVDLNKAMTGLRIVTGDNNEQAKELMKTYNGLARELGSTTASVSSGSQDWLRQGYSLKETNDLLKQSMSLSIMGNMDAENATTALTAALKGYQLQAAQASSVVDKFFAVDMAAATSSSKLADALAKTAANAKLAGISLNDVIGQLAAVNETMQEDGASTGTFYNTMLARIGAVKAGRLSDPETAEDLSDVEKTLRGAGIQLRTSETEFRNFGDVLDEVAGKWDSFSDTTRRAVASAFAGTRQQTRFIALMEGYNDAAKYSEVAANSFGVSAQKMAVYQEGIAAKANRMTAAFEKFSSTMISDGLIGFFYDLGAGILDVASAFDGWLAKVPLIITAIATIRASITGFKTTAFSKAFVGTFKDLAEPKMTGSMRNHVANTTKKAA